MRESHIRQIKEHEQFLTRRIFGAGARATTCVVTTTHDGDKTWAFKDGEERGVCVMRAHITNAESDALTLAKECERDGDRWLALLPVHALTRSPE